MRTRLGRSTAPFGWLELGLTVYATLVTTIVVITQNRLGRHEEQRAYLDLQVNLLVERKTTKIVELLEELRRDLPNVRNRHDPQAERMTQSIDAHAAVDAIEATMDEVTAR